jgi:type III pantothenate kinase
MVVQPMYLLIDIGNTNLHWAQFDGILSPMQTLRHHQRMPLDLLAAWERLPRPDGVLVGNVGGESVGQALGVAVRASWGLTAQFVAPCQEYLGVRVAYPQPARLGVDRWLALLAARARGPEATLILDLGTAATYDLLDPDGVHLGGLILPGLAMMRDSLLAGTGIPRDAAEPATDPWAADTGAAVATGSLHALAALAERLYARLRERAAAGAPPVILITGGDGPRIARLIDAPALLVPELVLLGLVRLIPAEGCR